jgi:hypothetical protein
MAMLTLYIHACCYESSLKVLSSYQQYCNYCSNKEGFSQKVKELKSHSHPNSFVLLKDFLFKRTDEHVSAIFDRYYYCPPYALWDAKTFYLTHEFVPSAQNILKSYELLRDMKHYKEYVGSRKVLKSEIKSICLGDDEVLKRQLQDVCNDERLFEKTRNKIKGWSERYDRTGNISLSSNPSVEQLQEQKQARRNDLLFSKEYHELQFVKAELNREIRTWIKEEEQDHVTAYAEESEMSGLSEKVVSKVKQLVHINSGDANSYKAILNLPNFLKLAGELKTAYITLKSSRVYGLYKDSKEALESATNKDVVESEFFKI